MSTELVQELGAYGAALGVLKQKIEDKPLTIVENGKQKSFVNVKDVANKIINIFKKI